MNLFVFFYSFSVIILTLLILYIYHKNSNFNQKFTLIKFEHQKSMDTANFQLDTIKVENLHKESLQKINEDRFKDERDYAILQLDREKSFYLKEKEIEAINGKNILDAVMPVIAQQNQHSQRMAEIKATTTNIFENKSK